MANSPRKHKLRRRFACAASRTIDRRGEAEDWRAFPFVPCKASRGHAAPTQTGSIRMQTPKRASQGRAGANAASRKFALVLAAIALIASLPGSNAFADEAKPNDESKDWPCHQILVDKISLPAVWSGPSIDNIDWRKDAATADLVALLAARKTPMDAADKAIENFAAAAGADKTQKLTALFAGLFETLNNERSDIIDGLTRFGHKQKALAAKIRAENAELQKSPDAAAPEGVSADNPLSKKLELDLRSFDEGRRSISFVCEAPTQVEQRLFALARSIQNSLD
jgi:hypothetical protein